MVGHVSMRSAQLWVQTEGPSEVVVEYISMATGQDAVWAETSPVQTDARSGTAHITLANLEPGTAYRVKLKLNDKAIDDVLEISTQVLWDYRMDHPFRS